MKFKKFLWGFFCYLLVIAASIMLGFVFYLKRHFDTATFEQLLYNLINMRSLNIVSVEQSISAVLFFGILFLTLFSIPLLMPCFIDNKLIIKIKDKSIQLFPIKLDKLAKFVFGASLVVLLLAVGIIPFIGNQLSYSTLYEDYYVEYDEDNLIFPEDKQNLIMIYIESFENTVFNKKNGGAMETSYTPNLEKLALNSINFSNTENIGGFRQVNGTNWTVASLVAQTAGIPIYIRTKSENNVFFEGAVTIGDILDSYGYRNVFMLGSNANFAERRKYFNEHGNYYIYDYDEARYNGDIPFDYFVWWGYEDNKLYENAREQLVKLAEDDEPFNFTLLTADTHYFEGYTDESCPKKFKNSYANSYYCMDIMLDNFLEWIQGQEFYKNTTVVVVGDHLTMRDDFFETDNDYERTVFNLFLNSRVDTEYTKNREFSAFDMFPTTLASLGVSIKDDRLALGTNLFSDKKTLIEELGYEEFVKELGKKSLYYDDKILKTNK